MKTRLLHILLFLLAVPSSAQTQLLKDYDFDSGGYYLLGAFAESDPNSLRDSMGEFYTDDSAVLNEFKKAWVVEKPGKRYSCGYHYTVFVCKEGQILESFNINLNCQEIVSDKGYFYFDTNLLRQFYGKLKPAARLSHSFNTVAEARGFRDRILKEPSLIMAPHPQWVDYEGSFQFKYKCKEGTKDCLDEDEKILRSIEAELRKKYPDEKFMLSNVGGSWTTIEVLVVCNKSLSDKFDLYHRDQEFFGKWEPFDLTIRTYWKAEEYRAPGSR